MLAIYCSIEVILAAKAGFEAFKALRSVKSWSVSFLNPKYNFL